MGNNQNKSVKIAPLDKKWHSTQSQFSFSSVHSGLSVASVQRPWSRTSRRRWRQSTLLNSYEASKTAWPVRYIESIFLPEFSIRGEVDESHFHIEEEIARGAFGSVLRVKKKNTGKIYAMKVLSKARVIMENAIQQCKDEVTIQSLLGHHPFIVQCQYHWQNRKELFIVTEYVTHGELLSLWKKYGRFSEELVRLYIAELALAIDFLQNTGVIYRDLKMENILIDQEGHLQLIDFGLAKWLSMGMRANTICGTIRYMAPEILSMKPYTHAVDWWSLGIIMYALLAGQYPIESGRDHTRMHKLVENCDYKLPSFCSDKANNVVKKLLCKDPSKRLQHLYNLKREQFFKKMDFDAVLERRISPLMLLKQNLKIFQKTYKSDRPKYLSSNFLKGFSHEELLEKK